MENTNRDANKGKIKRCFKCGEGSHIAKDCKRRILVRRMDFLGYIVENGTIAFSGTKTKAVENFPLPHDKKSLQSFLGRTSYFRRFIEGYAVVAKPLSDLLRKDSKFGLRNEEMAFFQQLKLALTKAPVLKLYNPKSITEVHADACT